MNDLDDASAALKERLARSFMYAYKVIESTCVAFDQEYRRKVYITPKSYLDNISNYKTFMDEK